MLFHLGNGVWPVIGGYHLVSVVGQELLIRHHQQQQQHHQQQHQQLTANTSLNGSLDSSLLFSRLLPSHAFNNNNHHLIHNNSYHNHHISRQYLYHVPSSSTRLPSDITQDKLLMDVRCSSGDLLGPLGLFVQFLLAFLAFTTLIAKRFCEPKHERRPWKIWFYDTSKQAIGAAVIHFANVFLADMFQGDPCTWYFVSFLLDSTVGLLVIYIGLKIGQWLALRNGWESLRFGEYGRPPQCNAWIGQCGVYILVMIIEKLLMTLLILCHFWVKVRKFILAPVKNANLEIVLVMFMVPLFVNALIFWVVDNFLKRQIRETKTLSISSNDVSVKYFRSNDRLKYYNHADKTEDFEANVLLMEDEEINTASVLATNNNTSTANLLLN